MHADSCYGAIRTCKEEVKRARQVADRWLACFMVSAVCNVLMFAIWWHFS